MDDLKEYYLSNIKKYEMAAQKIEKLIKEILETKNVQFHSVTSRIKSIDSYLKKAENYKDPKNEIIDYIGVRIITYVVKDMEKISLLIENNFRIDKINSENKSKALGDNKMGYRSIHYIISLNNDRENLPEYSICKDCLFEIQIRTILQHTWAEIEHDKNYKYSGVLPNNIKRRLNLLSAVLESADNEFNTISQEIDDYKTNVNSEIENDNLIDIALNSTSLKEYIDTKYGKYKIYENQISPKNEIRLIKELNLFDITNIKEIEEIINMNYLCDLENYTGKKNVMGVFRILMIIKDSDKYFDKCYDNSWSGINLETKKFFEKFYPDIIITMKDNRIYMPEG